MKFQYDTPKAFQVFYKYYFPLWQRAGFTWDMFPEITIYINTNPSTGGINSNKEHYSPSENYIFVRMPQGEEEIENMGLPFETFISVYPSSLFHEIGHHIHYKYGTKNDSPFWEKARELSGGKIGSDFKERTISGHYWWIPAHENFANYFEDIIERRIKNEKFLDWIAELVGVDRVKVIELTIGSDEVLINGVKEKIDTEPIIHKNRTLVPLRFIAEELGFEVKYYEDTKKVILTRLKEGE